MLTLAAKYFCLEIFKSGGDFSIQNEEVIELTVEPVVVCVRPGVPLHLSIPGQCLYDSVLHYGACCTPFELPAGLVHCDTSRHVANALQMSIYRITNGTRRFHLPDFYSLLKSTKW